MKTNQTAKYKANKEENAVQIAIDHSPKLPEFDKSESFKVTNEANLDEIGHCSTCVKMIPTACHASLFFLFAGSYLYNIHFDITHNRLIAADYIYLTHWNLTFQLFFTAIELLSDLFPSFSEYTASFRDKFFHSIVFPYSMFVSVFFWGICLYDEDLVREPPGQRPEEWYNHTVHTLVVPAAIFESLVTYHRLSPPLESGTITIILGFIYICWSIFMGVTFDLWAYELLRSSSVPTLAVFFLFCCCALLLFHYLGRIVHKKFWKN